MADIQVGSTVTIDRGHNSVKGRTGKVTAVVGTKVTIQLGTGRTVDAPLSSVSLAGAAASPGPTTRNPPVHQPARPTPEPSPSPPTTGSSPTARVANPKYITPAIAANAKYMEPAEALRQAMVSAGLKYVRVSRSGDTGNLVVYTSAEIPTKRTAVMDAARAYLKQHGHRIVADRGNQIDVAVT
jgi:hypothetical protein